LTSNFNLSGRIDPLYPVFSTAKWFDLQAKCNVNNTNKSTPNSHHVPYALRNSVQIGKLK